jgi:hypothetical protein
MDFKFSIAENLLILSFALFESPVKFAKKSIESKRSIKIRLTENNEKTDS